MPKVTVLFCEVSLKLIFTFTLLVFFCGAAQAGLHFEPMTYFAIGEAQENDTGIESKHLGYLYGLRLGLYKPKFHLGLEYSTGELNFEDQGPSSSAKTKETVHYMGAYLGFHLRKRVGLNLVYFPKVRFNSDSPRKLSGDGWKVELYYRVKTHVSLHIGYQHTLLNHDEVSHSHLSNSLESKTILIGTTFPFLL